MQRTNILDRRNYIPSFSKLEDCGPWLNMPVYEDIFKERKPCFNCGRILKVLPCMKTVVHGLICQFMKIFLKNESLVSTVGGFKGTLKRL